MSKTAAIILAFVCGVGVFAFGQYAAAIPPTTAPAAGARTTQPEIPALLDRDRAKDVDRKPVTPTTGPDGWTFAVPHPAGILRPIKMKGVVGPTATATGLLVFSEESAGAKSSPLLRVELSADRGELRLVPKTDPDGKPSPLAANITVEVLSDIDDAVYLCAIAQPAEHAVQIGFDQAGNPLSGLAKFDVAYPWPDALTARAGQQSADPGKPLRVEWGDGMFYEVQTRAGEKGLAITFVTNVADVIAKSITRPAAPAANPAAADLKQIKKLEGEYAWLLDMQRTEKDPEKSAALKKQIENNRKKLDDLKAGPARPAAAAGLKPPDNLIAQTEAELPDRSEIRLTDPAGRTVALLVVKFACPTNHASIKAK